MYRYVCMLACIYMNIHYICYYHHYNRFIYIILTFINWSWKVYAISKFLMWLFVSEIVGLYVLVCMVFRMIRPKIHKLKAPSSKCSLIFRDWSKLGKQIWNECSKWIDGWIDGWIGYIHIPFWHVVSYMIQFKFPWIVDTLPIKQHI